MKNENFITIQGWMRNELGLKGNELLAYALVHGFSQDGDSWFSGSAKYVADWLGIDRRNALEVLKRLTQKGLIIKQEKIVNGVKLADYKVCHLNIIGDDETSLGGQETSLGGGDETSHHNNSLGNPRDNKEKEIKEKVPTEAILEARRTDIVIGSMINEYTQNPKLNEALRSFIGYRKKKRAPMSDVAVKLMLKKLAPFSEDEQIEAIETSIVSNWAGVFPKHKNGTEEQKNVGKVAHGNEDYNEDFDMASYMERRRRQG